MSDTENSKDHVIVGETSDVRGGGGRTALLTARERELLREIRVNFQCSFSAEWQAEARALLLRMENASAPADKAEAVPAAQLERWGRGVDATPLLLQRLPDGYWTPWHIAQAALEQAAPPTELLRDLRELLASVRSHMKGAYSGLPSGMAIDGSAAFAMNERHRAEGKTLDTKVDAALAKLREQLGS